jgi:SWI/SNF-related matrix-associated actin-dependent regulator 1 of chromatin subfamily A
MQQISLETVPPEVHALLVSIPGVRSRAGLLQVPENASWLVLELLGGLETREGPRRSPGAARAAQPWLREWVPNFLTSYQREGIAWALGKPGQSSHFHWSAGSGKTLGAIVWDLAAGPSLSVVVTKAAIRPTWARELETYTQGVHFEVLDGETPGELTGSIPLDRPVVLVTGYDTLPGWIDALVKLRPHSVVFDEIHHVKSHQRWQAEVGLGDERKVSFSLKENRAAACYRLSRIAKRRLGLTATPITDRVRDLWAQLDLVHPGEWGTYWDWARRYAGATENTFGGMDDRGKSNLGELKRRLSYVSHRVPYSLANRDLPPKRRLITYVKVCDQNRAEGGISKELKKAAKFGPTAILEARLMEAASRKRKVVLAHARDALEGGLKVTIFTGRRVDCERLAAEAEGWKESWKGHRLSLFSGHGGDSPERREELRRLYMASPGPALLVGTGDAWGTGLDLQDTDLAIFAMLPYTPGQIIQYEGRFARLGQKRLVLIRYFIAEGTVDEHVAAILLGKLPAVERATNSDEITGLGRELIGASEEELVASLVDKIMGQEIGKEPDA